MGCTFSILKMGLGCLGVFPPQQVPPPFSSRDPTAPAISTSSSTVWVPWRNGKRCCIPDLVSMTNVRSISTHLVDIIVAENEIDALFSPIISTRLVSDDQYFCFQCRSQRRLPAFFHRL